MCMYWNFNNFYLNKMHKYMCFVLQSKCMVINLYNFVSLIQSQMCFVFYKIKIEMDSNLMYFLQMNIKWKVHAWWSLL